MEDKNKGLSQPNNYKPAVLIGFVFPVLFMLAWELFIVISQAIGIESTIYIVVPKPSDIIATMVSNVLNSASLQALAQTLMTTLLGFALGILGAVALGVLLGSSRQTSNYLGPTFHFLRSLPIALYVPLALVILSSDIRLPIALSSFITILYGAIPVMRAVSDYDQEKMYFLQARGYNQFRIMLHFVLPEIVGALYTSIRITTTLALAVTVVAEMLLQSLGGIGGYIIGAKESSQYTHLWAYTGLLGIAGYLFQKIMIATWKFALPWAENEKVN